MISEMSLPAKGTIAKGELRLAYLISQYPAVSHTFILREVRALRERGIVIEVASINDPHPLAQMTAIERAETEQTFYIKRAGPLVALLSLTWLVFKRPAGLARGLLTALRLGGADVSRTIRNLFYFFEAAMIARWMHHRALRHLHVHFATPAATVGVLVTKMAPVTLSITVHGPDEFYDVTTYSLLEKVEAARFIVCISFFAQSQLMKLAPPTKWKALSVIRLGVDCTEFQPRSPRIHECFTVLCVGRLVAAKGQRILIDAVERLVAAGRAVRLILVGEGADRSALEQFVSDKKLANTVTFAGAVNQDDIQAFYQQADAFAIASFAEGIPVVLMEAMAMEIPCIATRVMGIPELIEDGENGLLVAPSDVRGLGDALCRLMDDSGFAGRLGRAGRMRILQAYELNSSSDRLAALFHQRLVGSV